MSRGAGAPGFIGDATGEEFCAADTIAFDYWRAYGAEAAI